MTSGAPFIKYNIVRFNETGPINEVDEAVGAFVLGESEKSAVE
jgi:hypothetical protein